MYELEADREDQTIEQEYQSYVTGILSKLGTDMIKFWDVRTLILLCACAKSLLMKIRWIGRLAKQHILPYSLYQWTTSLSRHHQCPVNMCFCQLAKQTPQKETA